MTKGSVFRVVCPRKYYNFPVSETIVCYTVKPQFFKHPSEMKIGLKNQIVQEIGGKITVFD